MDHAAHSPTPHGTQHGSAHHDDHAGIGKYLAVFGALCVLTGASFWTYADWPVRWPFHDQPAVGWAFMMAVSCTKALLVVLFFMHVKYEASWKYVLTVPPVFMSIFLVLALVPDIGLRNREAFGGRVPSPERLANMAMPAAPHADDAHADHADH
ncbi:MAG: cytochrome C oxidase subunit IV family protein [Pirellulales bacterium]|nr:cytochrome C oxidase subunit IV family protein [Pirellulales bacterium]